MQAQNIICVLGKSFARIFHRNCVNLGLPVVVQADAASAAKPESEIRIDTDKGEIVVEGEHFAAEPIPPFMQDMISSGGLIPWAKMKLQEEPG
jgi:3-isopropylmalate dehydratase small subunit